MRICLYSVAIAAFVAMFAGCQERGGSIVFGPQLLGNEVHEIVDAIDLERSNNVWLTYPLVPYSEDGERPNPLHVARVNLCIISEYADIVFLSSLFPFQDAAEIPQGALEEEEGICDTSQFDSMQNLEDYSLSTGPFFRTFSTVELMNYDGFGNNEIDRFFLVISLEQDNRLYSAHIYRLSERRFFWSRIWAQLTNELDPNYRRVEVMTYYFALNGGIPW